MIQDLNRLSDEEFQLKFLEPRRPVIVADLQEGFDIPLQKEIKYVTANGVEIRYFDQLRAEMEKFAGQNVNSL